MSGRGECADVPAHGVVVATGPEASIGFGDFCTYDSDTAGCTPAQGGLGWKVEVTSALAQQLDLGAGAALVHLPSQPFNLWRAGAVGSWRSSPSVVSTGFVTATLGIASVTSAIPATPGIVGAAPARPVVPDGGLSIGRRWNPSDAVVLALREPRHRGRPFRHRSVARLVADLRVCVVSAPHLRAVQGFLAARERVIVGAT
jgi:hypothetical protein